VNVDGHGAGQARAWPGGLLDEHVGLVHAPLPQVRDVVLAIGPGAFTGAEAPLIVGSADGRRVTVSGGPARFTASIGGAVLAVEVDAAAGWVQARGRWWWCARLQVDPHPAGARLAYRTYNRADGPAARIVPFTVARGHRKHARQAMERILARIGGRLSCPTELLPD